MKNENHSELVIRQRVRSGTTSDISQQACMGRQSGTECNHHAEVTFLHAGFDKLVQDEEHRR